MKTMSVPNINDWGKIDKNDLDAQCAFKHFAGLSKEAAESLFKEHALYYQEDLLSMPEVAFNYYAPVFAKYLQSSDARGDSDGASSFLHMIIELLKTFRSLAEPETLDVLLSTAKLVSNQQASYDADIDIYGEFTELYEEITYLAKCT